MFVDERAVIVQFQSMGFVDPARKKQEHTLPAD